MLQLTVYKSFKKTYLWKKGDSLDKVARSNGGKNGDDIWKDPDNKDIVKKRGKPEQLVPGDKLVIFDVANATDRLKKTVEALRSSVAATQEKTDHYDDIIQQDEKVTDALVKEAEANLKKLQKVTDAAELVALCANMGKALITIGTVGFKAASASVKMLEKAHKQVLESVVDLHKEPFSFAAAKIAEKHTDSESKAVSSVAKAITLVSNWTSPFWLGNAWVRASSGQSTKEVFEGSLADDLKKEIEDTKKEGRARVAMYQASKQKSAATLAALKDQLKEAQSALKEASR